MSDQTHLSQEIVNDFVGSAHGDFDKVKSLLDQHPDLINARAEWNETAIEAAAQMGRVDIAEYLLAKGAPLDICTAAMLGMIGQVQAMVQTQPALVFASGAHSIPLLYFPVISNQRPVADYLLAQGAEVNAGEGNHTPLHGAVMFNQPEMVSWLLEHGANPGLRDYESKTPLERAQEAGRQEIVALLQENRAQE